MTGPTGRQESEHFNTGLYCWTVSPTALDHSSEVTGDVLVGQGGVDHPRGKGGGSEEGGGNEDGGRGGRCLLFLNDAMF